MWWNVFIFKRRNVLIICVLLITAITFFICFDALSKVPIGEASKNNIKIVLDAGHGGVDNGVCGINTGVKESEINLAVVKKLQKYLEDAGMSVVLTRNSDAGLYGIATKNLKKRDMQKRKEIIEKAEPHLVVSIHMNEYTTTTRRGAQVFYKKDSLEGKKLALSIQDSFNDMKESLRDFSPLIGDYFILNCSDFPSVIAECGFLSNPEEEALLVTEEYQDDIAYAVFKGIVGYLSQSSIVFTD